MAYLPSTLFEILTPITSIIYGFTRIAMFKTEPGEEDADDPDDTEGDPGSLIIEPQIL